MNDWKILAKARIKELRTSQLAVAEKIGCSQSAIAQWLSGKRKADIETVNKILEALKLPTISIGTENKIDQIYKYPLISWVLAGLPYEKWKTKTAEDFLNTDIATSEKGFWLKVKGDSMTSIKGYSFPEGIYILVNPDAAIKNDNFVIARLIKDNQATFRQYIEEAGLKYLKPLNNTYKTTLLDDSWQIVGKVVEAKWKLNE